MKRGLELTSDSINIFHRSGWTATYRCAQADDYIRCLGEAGYQTNSLITEFIHKFGGLQITIPYTHSGSMGDWFHTRVDEAVDGQSFSAVQDWAKRIDAVLCVVGEVYMDHMCLVIDQNGGMYAGDGVLLLCIGATFTEGIHNLCTGVAPRKID